MSTAAYHTDAVHRLHRGNPLIEALRPSLPDKEITKLLMKKPDIIVRDEVLLPPHLRVHGVAAIADMYIPNSQAVDLYSIVDIEMKRSLSKRSPFSPETQRHLESVRSEVTSAWKKSEGAIAAAQKRRENELAAIGGGLPDIRSVLVLAPSGKGKSTMISHVLNANPQTIQHTVYKGRPFLQKQLVWLSVRAPLNASISGFCHSIIHAVDNALELPGEQSYSKQYLGRRQVNETLIGVVGQILATHYLGILHLDDVQRIADGTGANISSFISFLMQLSDVLGIPLILSGTTKLVSILSRSVEVARRACSAGTVELTLDRTFSVKGPSGVVMSGLFKFQLFQEKCKDEIAVMRHLHNRSQDITSITVGLYLQSHYIGLRRGDLSLSESLIDLAYEGIKPLHPALSALRKNDGNALEKWEDIIAMDQKMKALLANHSP